MRLLYFNLDCFHIKKFNSFSNLCSELFYKAVEIKQQNIYNSVVITQ